MVNSIYMNYHQLIEEVSGYVTTYYQSHSDPRLVYHNLRHTEYMVGRAIEIAKHYKVNDADYFVIVASGWFHDIGYMDDLKNHEDRSANIAETWLAGRVSDKSVIASIKSCIMATKMPQSPFSLPEKIICDADLYHLGAKEFFETDGLLRKEMETIHGANFSDLDWKRKSIVFLSDHHYHTGYCQELLGGVKQKNILRLEEEVISMQKTV